MDTNRRMASMDLGAWVDSRQAQGLYWFTRAEALASLNTTETALKQAAARLVKKRRVARIRNGFFVIVPLEYASRGILPGEWFIDGWMNEVRQQYYVGLLSAAALHGAAHQQPMQFQVVTSKPQRPVQLPGLTIRFFSKQNIATTPTVQLKAQTGYMRVSTPETTALDLVHYARAIGGLDRVLTVLGELGESLDPKRLSSIAQAEPSLTDARRLGWLLERAGFPSVAKPLAQRVEEKRLSPIKLEPALPLKDSPLDIRWRLRVNTDVAGDL